MKNAKARYRFLGQDLSRVSLHPPASFPGPCRTGNELASKLIPPSLFQVKNILAADPYGKQAEKRKKEVSDLEARVGLLLPRPVTFTISNSQLVIAH